MDKIKQIRDLFEGAIEFDTAACMAGVSAEDIALARAEWQEWTDADDSAQEFLALHSSH
jgi:hypothetical protein